MVQWSKDPVVRGLLFIVVRWEVYKAPSHTVIEQASLFRTAVSQSLWVTLPGVDFLWHNKSPPV